MDPNLIGHFGNLLYATAYLVRDILWLRILSIIACMASISFNYYAPASPLWTAIFWNIFFVGVNVVQVAILFKERAGVKLTDLEKEMYETIFSNLTPVEFLKILRIGEWRDLNSGSVLISKGKVVSELVLIYNGTVTVQINDDNYRELKDGTFLGEMAFLTGEKASATLTSKTDLKLFVWQFDALKKLFNINPALRSAFHSIISGDLIKKLRTQVPFKIKK